MGQLAMKSNGIDGLNEHSAKFGLTFFCCALLIPAWKNYMIPFMVAEGWNYTFPLRIEDVSRMAEQMVGIKPEGEEAEEAQNADEIKKPWRRSPRCRSFSRICKNPPT